MEYEINPNPCIYIYKIAKGQSVSVCLPHPTCFPQTAGSIKYKYKKYSISRYEPGKIVNFDVIAQFTLQITYTPHSFHYKNSTGIVRKMGTSH
jgi:hypothetical protein